MVPSVEKKRAELEMGLLHLQQKIDIPEISLPIHQQVEAMAKKCAAEKNCRPKVQDFGDKVEDSTLLNQLQNSVNRWIREIQKVTKLDHDPASDTALQEINFWLNLERALLRIQVIRESPDVALTLEILKHDKRFHATVSFDTDTGLKQALATANDYNPLTKIRTTNYPIQRALRLMEAISRDLSTSTATQGILPREWRQYTVPKKLTVLQWVVDFGTHIKQLQTVSQAAN